MMNNELKKIAALEIEREYGFRPTLTSIVLMEASGDGRYIMFRMKNHEYCWDGVTLEKRSGNELRIADEYNNYVLESWKQKKAMQTEIEELKARLSVYEAIEA